MQATEGCIQQVKLGSSSKMMKIGNPKPLRDHCLELGGGIRSHTALDIYGLAGQVPETILTGETGGISNLCKFKWFQRVMQYEPTDCYPDGKAQIGRWLGPAPVVSTAMSYKALKATGWFAHRGTVRALFYIRDKRSSWIGYLITWGGQHSPMIPQRRTNP